MSSALWANLHGGSTHFPIALLFSSFLFDLAGYALNRNGTTRDLHAAAFYALLLGTAASFVAVLSGLVLSGWHLFGSGSLLKHHQFVWPAFGLIVGLSVWRLVVRDRASRPAFGLYLLVALAATGAMLAAGYWGGELSGGG